MNTAFSGQPNVVSAQQTSSGATNIRITLPTAVTAAAFNFGTFGGSTIIAQLSNAELLHLPTSPSGYAASNFFGITDTTPFSWIQLVASGADVINVRDVSFGTLTSSAVPEPSSLALLCLGACAGAIKLRRSRKATSSAA